MQPSSDDPDQPANRATEPESLHITDLEAAINYWCARLPPDPGAALPPPSAALAQVYAHMICSSTDSLPAASLPASALQAWLAWYDTQPDAPCIAICSTSQGDDVCKGCGRTFWEVQHWLALSPFAKRATWRRITQQGTAWRFNRYAERGQPQP